MILSKKRTPKPVVTVPYTQMFAGQASDKVWQEFFCRTSRQEDVEAKRKADANGPCVEQPGCGGYFIVSIMAKFTGKVNLACPKCGHKHTRYVQNGYIQESGRCGPGDSIDLKIMLSAWSQEPRTKAFHQQREENRKSPRVWDAVVIKSKNDLIPEAVEPTKSDAVARTILRESWLNKLFGD